MSRARSQKALKEVSPNHPVRKDPEPVSVKKWIDYSSKYGIGYTLSNGVMGVYFNDSTKILAAGEEHFHYIERVDREDVARRYSFREHPAELKKKVSLFSHFRGYLQAEGENRVRAEEEGKLVYVRRWFRSKHAVIFRLSNKSVQVIFIDQSELLINSLSKQVVYVNKLRERSEYALADVALSDNRELVKRYCYPDSGSSTPRRCSTKWRRSTRTKRATEE